MYLGMLFVCTGVQSCNCMYVLAHVIAGPAGIKYIRILIQSAGPVYMHALSSLSSCKPAKRDVFVETKPDTRRFLL